MEGDDGGNKEDERLLPRGSKVSADGNAHPTGENGKKISKISKRQWILLVFFGAINLLSSMMIALQAPFYPKEAESKGANATEYGLIFGSFEFVVFIVAPVYGKYMNKIGPKNLFSMCIIITSASTVSFGLLHYVNDHTWFITLGFLCRIFEALGAAGFFTATFAIIACEFPDSVSTTFASLEIFIGLGQTIGPTVGGALFDFGGFPLPFYVTGGLLLFVGVTAMVVMPSTAPAVGKDGTEEKGFGIWTILKIPSVALAALSTVSTEISLGFLTSTLEPHIRQFGLTPLQIGLVFIVNGGVYALTAPLIGYLCDNVKHPVYISLMGNLLVCASFLLIGPAVFVPLDTTLWLIIVGLSVQGLGIACSFASTFVVGLRDSIKSGLPDNITTYAACSGLWQSIISLGACIGPSAGGFLYDQVGFRQGSWLSIISSFTAAMAIVIYTCCCSSGKSPSTEESEPLLEIPSSKNPAAALKDSKEALTGPTFSKSSYGAT